MMRPRCALLIAFNFPPLKISSGQERTLAMVRHLPDRGWKPIVLSARARAYPATSNDRLREMPEDTVVHRSFAFDAGRDFAIRGRFPRILTLPDRWQTWVLFAVPAGLWLIRKYRPDVIWSTYPIASAHIIAYVLHRLSGLPWIADFRDPMVEFDGLSQSWSPSWKRLRDARLAIESSAAHYAAISTFCTDGSRDIFLHRHGVAAESAVVIPNGFDESAFRRAERGRKQRDRGDAIVLLHSGTIYATPDRDPSAFLRAFAQVLTQRGPSARRVLVTMRASSVESVYASLVREHGLEGCVDFAPSIPYEEALREMLDADGLLLFQGHTSNPAVPAKVYEYFRAGRPILAMVDDEGDTAKLLQAEGVHDLCSLTDEGSIVRMLYKFIARIEAGAVSSIDAERAQRYERSHGVSQFAALFDRVTAAGLDGRRGEA